MIHNHRSRRAGLTLAETLAALLALLILLAIAVPTLARTRGVASADGSLANLAAHGVGHVLYAADWNGRQYAPAPDELSQYGSTPMAAATGYLLANDIDQLGVRLGWGPSDEAIALWGFWISPGQTVNTQLLLPIDFQEAFGHFRVPNAKPLHDYIDGRFYGLTHFAPGDEVLLEAAQPGIESPWEFTPSVALGDNIWSSYCRSPAALYDANVFRAPSAGGWQNPFSLDHGFATPPLAAAAHPHLKTMLMEHNWVRGAPSPCHPDFVPCTPWQFNHGIDAEPAALFYDGHVRVLPNAEVQASDQMVLAGSGGIDGLWSRDTPLGATGYFNDLAFDPIVNVSHHVLTTGGILGRDTLGPMMTGLSMPRIQPRRVGILSAAHPVLPAPPVVEDAPWSP